VELVREGPPGTWSETGVRFGVLQFSGSASILVRNATTAGVWHFVGNVWTPDSTGLNGLELDNPLFTVAAERDLGVRLRDLDGEASAS